MKKFFTTIVILGMSFLLCACTNSKNDFTGRWAEKTSERVVMDIYPDKNDKEYNIFITWREDNLPQKDIYRFHAKTEDDNSLKYNNGLHIIRTYDSKGTFKDKIDYQDGTGTIKIGEQEIEWTDNKDNNTSAFKKSNDALKGSTMVKNRMFSFILPQELKGFYIAAKEPNRVTIYDKNSTDKGFGGFAFGIKAYKSPSEHATLPGSRKIGELTYKKNLYDIVLKYPTDVQYDYKHNVQAPDSYKLLYDIAENLNIQGENGYTYFKNQGTKGEGLYKDILKKHMAAIKSKLNSTELEKKNMSYMYNEIAQTGENVLDKIGYAYYDVNADGIDELLIGEIADGNLKGVIYDIYTMVDRKPQHVISGGSRNRYYVCNDVFLCDEYSSGAAESGMNVYVLVENSSMLFPQVGFKYDEYKDKTKPYFISNGNFESDKGWEKADKKTFEDRKKVFDNYKRFDFIPFSKLK